MSAGFFSGAANAYAHTSYYIVSFLFLLWTAQLTLYLRSSGFSGTGFIRKNWPGLLFALAAASFCFISVPPRFRTLSDETNLLGISHAMLLEKTVYNITMGKRYYGSFTPLLHEIDKRRLLFPFLTHLLHACLGYDYRNAFILNFLTLFAFLAGVFLAVRRFFDAPTAAGAVLLILSQPVVTLFAASGGFDFFAAAFLALTWVVAYSFMEAPTEESLAFLWLQLLMLAQTRYESFLYFFLILGLLWRLGYLRPELFARYRHVYAVTPVLLIPVALQLVMSASKGIYENPPGVPAFGLAYIGSEARAILQSLVDFRFYLPYANLLFWISGATLLIVAYDFFPSRNSVEPAHRRHVLLIAGFSLAAQTFLYLSYYAGHFVQPSSARFYIGAAIAASLIPLALRFYWPEVVTPERFLLFSAAVLALYHPVAVENKFVNTLNLIRETEEEMSFLKSLGDKRILVIADRPGQFASLDYGAVDFRYAKANARDLFNELSRHLYLELVVLQRINYKTGHPEPETSLGPDFPLETLQEIQVTADDFLRISRVTAGP